MVPIKVYLLVTYGLSCLIYDIRIIQNMGDLDFFNLSSSLMVKCDDYAVGLPRCDFLLVFISKTWPNLL